MKSVLFRILQLKKEKEMEAKGKSGMIMEYVIRDKEGNIKEQGIEGVKRKENGNIDK